ncbi:MAG: hypothetical protein LBK08_04885 [Treponema sp.]|jgi:hypothetical protein|nr:hypothetical protein [Treponema sp.]
MNGRGRRIPALVFLLLPAFLFGGSRPEEKEILDREWTLCISAFDVSALSPSRHIVGSVIMRDLAASLEKVERRIRGDAEHGWYAGYAHSRERNAAAAALAAKLEERGALLYQGEPRWKYRRDLAAADKEIKKLKDELEEIERNVPSVDSEPVFVLTGDNLNGNFPPPPAPGTEYRFCRDGKADALLSGSVSEYYGRVYLVLRLYTVSGGGWIYEDSIIFSPEDINSASDEIAGRLASVVSGSRAAVIAVRAEPPEAEIAVNSSFAGRGSVPEREHAPGNITVIVSAEGYRSETVETELEGGMRTDIGVKLMPLDLSFVRLSVPGKAGVIVYRGAFYEGEAPLSFGVDSGGVEYFSVETSGGETGSVVFLNSGFMDSVYEEKEILLATAMPPRPGQHDVEEARRRYYGAWGRLWIALPAAFLITGLAEMQSEGWNTISSSGAAPNLLYSRAVSYRSLRWGAWALAGAALTDVMYSLWRYIQAADKNTVRIVK